MIVTYQPEGAPKQEWPFQPTKLMSPEVEAIERNTGMHFGEWMDAVGKGSMIALHGLLFVMLKRKNPTLKWDEVQFCLDDVNMEFEPDEAREMWHTLKKKSEEGPLDDASVAIMERLEREGFGGDEDTPKAEADTPPASESANLVPMKKSAAGTNSP